MGLTYVLQKLLKKLTVMEKLYFMPHSQQICKQPFEYIYLFMYVHMNEIHFCLQIIAHNNSCKVPYRTVLFLEMDSTAVLFVPIAFKILISYLIVEVLKNRPRRLAFGFRCSTVMYHHHVLDK